MFNAFLKTIYFILKLNIKILLIRSKNKIKTLRKVTKAIMLFVFVFLFSCTLTGQAEALQVDRLDSYGPGVFHQSIDVRGVSLLGGTLVNPHAPLTIGDTLDVRGPIVNGFNAVTISDDLVVEGKAIFKLGQIVQQSTTDYQGTIFNSTEAVTIGDDLRVDGYLYNGSKDYFKIFDDLMIQGDVYPLDGGMYDLGKSGRQWRNLYSRNINVNTLNSKDVNYTGTLTGSDANFTDDVTIGDRLVVNGTSNFMGNIFDSVGNLTVADSMDVTGNTALAGTLSVTKATTLGSTLAVTGASTLNDTLNVVSLSSLDGGIDVDGAFTVADTSGNTVVGGTLAVNGNAAINNNLTVTGTSDLQGTVYNSLGDNITIGDSLIPNGATSSQRYLGFGSNTWNEAWLDGAVVIRTGSGSAQHSASFGFVTDTGSNEATSYTDQYYRVDNGDLGTDTSYLYSNRVEVTDGTNTSTYGVNANVDGNISVAGTSDFQGAISDSTGDLTVNDNLDIINDLNVGSGNFFVNASNGNTTVGGTLGVTGATTLSSTLNTTGLASLDGGIDVNGSNLTVASNGNLNSIGTLTASTLTDGSASLSAGNLSGVGTLTATTITDGTATLTGGNLTGAGTINATTLQQGGVAIDNIYVNENGDTMAGALDMNNNTISNIGAAGTDFSGTGGLTLADALTVSANGASVAGGLNNNNGGITNSGAIAGATTITASGAIQGGSITDGTATLSGGNLTGVGTNITASGALTVASGGASGLTLDSASGTVGIGAGDTLSIGSGQTLDVTGATITGATAKAYYTFGSISVPTNGNYFIPGSGNSVQNEIFIPIPTSGTVTKMYVYARVASGGGITDTYTLRNNGVASGMSVTLANVTSGNDTSNTFSVNNGDRLSLLFNTDGATATDDIVVTVEIETPVQ